VAENRPIPGFVPTNAWNPRHEPESTIREMPGHGDSAARKVENPNAESVIHTIFEGTSEIQQLVISRAISGLRIE
jgi:acyl-CoA dehydrogenase